MIVISFAGSVENMLLMTIWMLFYVIWTILAAADIGIKVSAKLQVERKDFYTFLLALNASYNTFVIFLKFSLEAQHQSL